jgi:hypothetical protein
LEIFWLGLTAPKLQEVEPLLLVSEFRRLTMKMRPLLGEAGWGKFLRNEQEYRGEEYGPVFVQDLTALLVGLNGTL